MTLLILKSKKGTVPGRKVQFLSYNEPQILVGSKGWEEKWRGFKNGVMKLDFFSSWEKNLTVCLHAYYALFGGWAHLPKASVWPVGGLVFAGRVLPLPLVLPSLLQPGRPTPPVLLWPPVLFHWYIASGERFSPPPPPPPHVQEDFLAEKEIGFLSRCLQESICCLFFWHFVLSYLAWHHKALGLLSVPVNSLSSVWFASEYQLEGRNHILYILALSLADSHQSVNGLCCIITCPISPRPSGTMLSSCSPSHPSLPHHCASFLPRCPTGKHFQGNIIAWFQSHSNLRKR